MPRIKAASLDAHHELVWGDIIGALHALLNERDYDTITLGHVAERAGLARNSLYRYAPDKTALMRAVAERVSAPTVTRIATIAAGSEPATARVRNIVAAILPAFSDSTIRLMLQPSLLMGISDGAPETRAGPFGAVAISMEGVIRDGLQSGEFRTTADVSTLAWLLGGIIRSAAEALIHDQLQLQALLPVVQDLVIGALTGP